MSRPRPDVLYPQITISRRTLDSVLHLEGARTTIAAGVDGLAHLFVDRAPDAEFGKFAAAHGVFVVPTLTVLKSITGVGGAAPLAEDPRFSAYLTRQDLMMLRQGFPRRPGMPAVDYAFADATVKQLRAAHVPILAGTDAGNPGTAHGAAMHCELELLVNAGLTPTEALAAATSVPAKTFHLNDRGRIAEGARADIASQLKLSEGTVRNYLSEAITKLGAKNRVEAARIARDRGWL